MVFLIIFLALSAVFIIFSLSQSQDLVSDDYYDQGANYSNQIAINKRSLVYNDSISIHNTDSEIHISICKSIVNSVDSIRVFFYRPSDKKEDMKYKLPVAEVLHLSKSDIVKGRYILKLSWHMNDKDFFIEKELYIN